MQYVGFSGGGFNEIRLQDQIYPGTAFNPAAYESGAYDSFAAIGTGRPSETPLPSTWLMLLSGFVGLGFISYRGTKKNSAAPSAA